MDRIGRFPLFRKISTKIVAGFIAVVAIFTVLGFVVTHEVSYLRTAEEEALARSEGVQLLQQAELALNSQIQAQYRLIIENDAGQIDAFMEAQERRQNALQPAASHVEGDNERELLERLKATADEFDAGFENGIIPAWQAGEPARIVGLERESVNLQDEISNYCTLLVTSFNSRNEKAQAEVDRANSRLRYYYFFTALIGLTLSFAITILAARRLSRPVEELKKAASAMVEGDLDRRVFVSTHDEIAELGNTFNLLADAVQHEIVQLASLADIALAISSELDWEKVINIVMKKGMELTGSQASAVVFYDERQMQFTDTYSRGLSEKFVSRMQFRSGGLADECLLGDTAVFSDDVEAEHGLSSLAREEGIRAFICLPLKVRQKRLGVLYVYSKVMDSYDRDDLAMLTILSNQVSIAIQNARLYERSQEEAVTDGLTGLNNQRFFYSRLKEELERSDRTGKPVSVIFCDLDRFKSFNDINGHAMGDLALKEVSRIIASSKREIDIAARYGGEEFALVLPETDSSGAQIIAHRICRRIAGFSFEGRKGANSILAASMGVASYPEDGLHTQELVEKADWAMYFSKRHGGNRVTLFHEEIGNYDKCKLEDMVREELHLAAVQAMAASVDETNAYSQQHSESVARLASSIAAAMQMEDDEVHRIRVAGLLHDVGLVSIPPEIINKRESLTEEEWARIKEHPEISESILRHVSSLDSFLPVVRHHHEHFDGAGYPDGLCGEDIPVGARIIAVADAFQAMTSDRPYRKALTIEQALTELRMSTGTQFDPQVIEAFIRIMEPPQAKAS